jgi:hypothetical protein
MKPRPQQLSKAEIAQMAGRMTALRTKLIGVGLTQEEDQEYTALIERWGSYTELRTKSWLWVADQANRAPD